jgi:hypothetical protein
LAIRLFSYFQTKARNSRAGQAGPFDQRSVTIGMNWGRTALDATDLVIVFSLFVGAMHESGTFCWTDERADIAGMEAQMAPRSPARAEDLRIAYQHISAMMDGGIPTPYEVIVTFARQIHQMDPAVTLYGKTAFGRKCLQPASVPMDEPGSKHQHG